MLLLNVYSTHYLVICWSHKSSVTDFFSLLDGWPCNKHTSVFSNFVPQLEYVLDPRELQSFATQIARGMAYLEGKHITHRFVFYWQSQARLFGISSIYVFLSIVKYTINNSLIVNHSMRLGNLPTTSASDESKRSKAFRISVFIEMGISIILTTTVIPFNGMEQVTHKAFNFYYFSLWMVFLLIILWWLISPTVAHFSE